MVYLLRTLISAAALWASIVATSQAEIVPFYTFNQSPFAQVFGLPALGEAIIERRGRTRAHLITDITSHYFRGRVAGEEMLLDMETYRTTLMLRHGLWKRFEIGIDLPYLVQDAGFLDQAINEWHKLFSFPEGGRDEAGNNDFAFYYIRDGEEVLRVNEPGEGMADFRFTAAYQIYKGIGLPRRSIALRASVKFPTANSDKLLGSGDMDYSYALHFHEKHVSGSRIWAWFASAGTMQLGRSRLLPEMQNDMIYFANAGFGWHALSNLTFKAQLDFHTPFYDDSQLRQLGDGGGQIVFGGSFRMRRKFYLDIGVAEDISVHTAPDVTFHIRISKNI